MFKFAVGAEAAGERKVVLGPEADNLNLVAMVSRKLRDGGRFGPARRSMGREEPQQDWTVAVDGLSKRCDRSVGHVEDLIVKNQVGGLQLRQVGRGR